MTKQPKVYMSFSTNPDTKMRMFRVIDQGQPLSIDKATPQDAMAAAKQYNLHRAINQIWDGDDGNWLVTCGQMRNEWRRRNVTVYRILSDATKVYTIGIGFNADDDPIHTVEPITDWALTLAKFPATHHFQ